jgi:hypothetical protein
MSWPDPARRGEPADAARPWHWLSRSEDEGRNPQPFAWNPNLRQWTEWNGGTHAAAEAAWRFSYVGPALTPEEVQLARDDGQPRGLAGLAASALPDPPPAMVYRKDAVRNHLLIFAGTLFGTLFIVDKFNILR